MESLAEIAATVPDLIIEVPNRRNWFRPNRDELPKSLVDDLDAWLVHDQGTDMRARRARVQAGGRRRRGKINARTAASYRCLVLEFIGMEMKGGIKLLSLRTLADVVETENVNKGLTAYEEHFNGEKRPHLGQVMRIICLVARHWVGVTAERDSELWEWAAEVSVPRHTMTEKNKDMLLSLRDERRLAMLFGLCRVVFRELLAKPRLGWRDAVRAQVAFAIALLLNAPARIGNVAAIDLDINLRRVGTGADEKVFLMFPGDDVKNGDDLLYPLGPRTKEMLDLYLSRSRPLLMRGKSTRWLFPGEGDGCKGFSHLSQQIASLTEEIVGVRITAHQFRHIAATLLLERCPNGMHAASKLLGHKSDATTSKIYAWLRREDVLKAWNELLLTMENDPEGGGGRRQSRPRRRRS